MDRYISLVVEYNTEFEDNWLTGIIEVARANSYRRRCYFRAAEQSYKKAIQIFLDLNDYSEVADTYLWLGGSTVLLIATESGKPIDTSETVNARLIEAESYFREALHYFDKEDIDWHSQFRKTIILAWEGIIARMRGQLDQARNLLQSCLSKIPQLIGVAQAHHELALIEHLAGNKELAYSYEEKGTNLFRQIGALNDLLPIIDRMKREGTW